MEELKQLTEEEVRIAKLGLRLGTQFFILVLVAIVTTVIGIEMGKIATMWVAIVEMIILIPYGCVTLYKMMQLHKERKVLLFRIIELLEKESVE